MDGMLRRIGLIGLMWLLWMVVGTPARAQELKQAGVLVTDASRGETLLNINWGCRGTIDRPVLIESRSRESSETARIREIYGNFLWLSARLNQDFLAGARVYQSPDLVDCTRSAAGMDEMAQAPLVSCDPARSRVAEGQSATLRASASDPNNDPLTYHWQVDGQPIQNEQPVFEFGATGRALGEHTVTVTVADSGGLRANCDFSVTVERRPNRNPEVALQLDRNQVYSGEPIQAQAEARDPDGDPLSYRWSIDDRVRPESGSRLEIETGAMAGGRHTAMVTVSDDREGSASDVAAFAVRERLLVQMDGSQPDNVAKARLDEIALKMRQDPQLQAVVTGHTDDRGSSEANASLGMRRAEAVKAYLVTQHQIEAVRIEARSAGEGQPVADNQTSEGRKENRRAQIELFVP